MSTRAYAKAYLAATAELPVTERLGWLTALEDRQVVRTLRRSLSLGSTKKFVETFAMPVNVAQFLKVLAEDRVLDKLPQIATQALSLARETGIGTAMRITAAKALSEAERNAAVAAIAPSQVVADFQEDSRLGGGFKITLGGRTIDQSLAARVSALRRALTTA